MWANRPSSLTTAPLITRGEGYGDTSSDAPCGRQGWSNFDMDSARIITYVLQYSFHCLRVIYTVQFPNEGSDDDRVSVERNG